jgi:hypothetical protein
MFFRMFKKYTFAVVGSGSLVGLGEATAIHCGIEKLEHADGQVICGSRKSTFVQETTQVTLLSTAAGCRVSFDLGMENAELKAGKTLPKKGLCSFADPVENVGTPDQDSDPQSDDVKFACTNREGHVFGTMVTRKVQGTTSKKAKGALS